MKPSEVLIAAKGLIDAPEKWIQGDIAMTEGGKELIDLYHPEAKCFCVTGALKRVAGDDLALMKPADYFIEAIAGQKDVARWNDISNRTHAEVMAAFDRAIALAQENGE